MKCAAKKYLTTHCATNITSAIAKTYHFFFLTSLHFIIYCRNQLLPPLFPRCFSFSSSYPHFLPSHHRNWHFFSLTYYYFFSFSSFFPSSSNRHYFISSYIAETYRYLLFFHVASLFLPLILLFYHAIVETNRHFFSLTYFYFLSSLFLHPRRIIPSISPPFFPI